MRYVVYVLAIVSLAQRFIVTERFFWTCFESQSAPNIDNHALRIIDGQPAHPGQFPWHVLLNLERGFCGGSLISNRWVLTAAHCINGQRYQIQLGSVDQGVGNEPGRIEIESTRAFIHPDYVRPYLHDIALVELPYPVTTTDTIKTIRVYNNSESLPGGVNVTVTGWGIQRNGTLSRLLNFVGLTTLSNKECEETLSSLASPPSILCAIGNPYESACRGDSGGPLVTYERNGEPVQVGVVSFGHGAGCTVGYPNGFTRPDFHMDWIHKITGLYE